MSRPAGVAQVTGYEAVRAAARDWEVFSSEYQGQPDVRTYRQYPLEADPPAHGAYRAILTPLFQRGHVTSLEAALRTIAAELVSQLVSAGRAEAIGELALPMVVRSLAHAFGRPQDAGEWLAWGGHLLDGPDAGRSLHAYLDRVFDEVEREPGGDAFSHIAAARIEGRRLTRLERIGVGSLILAGGRDTVVNLIAASIWRLGSRPAERARLATDPSAIPTALDELLRYLSPLPEMERRLTRPVGDLERGSHVALSFISANHDPSVFADPGTIDLARHPNRHLAFGNGPHTCIGAHLGKLEAQVFLEELLSAAPGFELRDGASIVWRRAVTGDVPGEFLRLPVAVEP
jgi:cytochrome P450